MEKTKTSPLSFIKKWCYDKRLYFFVFFLPVAIMFSAYAFFKIHPIGDSSVLVLDLNGQYVYYYEQFRDAFHGNGSFIYNWSRNLSGEMFGVFAYYLASQLINMGINVKIIEKEKDRCERLSILLPKAVIINADGTDQDVLKEEGLSNAESFVALTGIDEENILLTLHARHVSDAKTITKINRSNFKEIINNLNLGSVFYPSFITAETITAYVRAKSNTRSMNSCVQTLYHMFDFRVEAIEFRVDEASEVTGKPLMDLKLKKDVLIAFINRNGTIITPSGHDTIEVGDTAMVVTTHTGFNDIRDILV